MFPISAAAKCLRSIVILGGALALMPARSPAQTKAEPSRFEIGIEERIRSENWNNALDQNSSTNDEREQLRFRTRLFTTIPVAPAIDLYAGIADESVERFGNPSRLDEIYFDGAYINFKKVFVKGLALRVGRQDLKIGEGFLLWDGTPGDGSRSGYFNAADLSWSVHKSRLDLIAILDPARDRLLPVLHGQQRLLQTWDEQAIGAYYTDTNHQNTAFEAYYFLKKEIHDARPATNPQFQPDRHISTIGGRVVQRFPRGLTWTSEYARQWGAQHGGAQTRAWGGYSYLRYTFNSRLKPHVQVGYTALSGDDPQTQGRIENWDPLFSQWAKWSEMEVYPLGKETGAGYWTNLRMPQCQFGFIPYRKLNTRVTWYHMGAFHPFPGSPQTFAAGTSRGENIQIRTEYALHPDLKAYIHYETHHPGNFYGPARATSYFVQAQLTWQVKFAPLAN